MEYHLMHEDKMTRASSVYDLIRHDIMNGNISPGEKLLFDALREHYRIGISPLREALNRLDTEGWVVREERKGFRAAPTSEAELRQIVESRILTESAAISAGIARGDTEAEERVVLAFHRLSKESRARDGMRSRVWERLHKDFHVSLAATAGLEPITAFCAHLFDRAERYRILYATEYSERNERQEHADILQAYVDGDADRTRCLLAAHYQVTLDLIVARGL
jgi:DNA-binding GntR family transcriptional regulator